LDKWKVNQSSERARKRSGIEGRDDEAATIAIGTLYEGRTRHVVADKYVAVYNSGPSLSQIGDMVRSTKFITLGVC
jgi:hypothetical protein